MIHAHLKMVKMIKFRFCYFTMKKIEFAVDLDKYCLFGLMSLLVTILLFNYHGHIKIISGFPVDLKDGSKYYHFHILSSIPQYLYRCKCVYLTHLKNIINM